MKDNKRIICDNYNPDEYYPEEVIKDIAIECGWIESEEELTEEKIWEYQQEEIDTWIGDELDEMRNYFDGKTLIFFGSVGRWDGRYAGGRIGEFNDLFNRAMKDCDYLKLYDEKGHLFLQCSHHDGTNVFEIKELTQAGIDYMDRWEYGTDRRTEQDAHRQVIKRYSRLPHYADNVYGKISRKKGA